jgi:hypothetical protein
MSNETSVNMTKDSTTDARNVFQARTLCYVTSFLDIQRDQWTHFQRTPDKYDFLCCICAHMNASQVDVCGHVIVTGLKR